MEVLEQIVDLIFVEMVGKVASFDSVVGLVVIDSFEEFDWMGLRIVVEYRMVSIADIENKLHNDFSILDSKVVIVAEPKTTKLDSNYFVKIGKIVVV